MPWPQSEASRLHLERARDHEGGSKTAWCADYWQEEVPGQRVVMEGVKEAKKPPCQPKYMKMVPKIGGFAQKYFLRYTPKMLFEDYITFNIFRYLRLCGVIRYRTCLKFRESYTPPAIRIRGNGQ